MVTVGWSHYLCYLINSYNNYGKKGLQFMDENTESQRVYDTKLHSVIKLEVAELGVEHNQGNWAPDYK